MRVYPVLGLILSLVLLAGCGGGGGVGGSSNPPAPSPNAGGGFVLITSPTSDPTFTTGDASITLAGDTFRSNRQQTSPSCSAEVTVTWTNSTAGQSGPALVRWACWGWPSWVTSNIPLAVGANTITVTATDADGKLGRATIIVTRDPSISVPVPTVEITEPTADPAFVTANLAVTLAGTAPNAVVVSWSNAATGAFGDAAGTATWTATIPLAAGANPVTVRATNGNGRMTSVVVTIYRTGSAWAWGDNTQGQLGTGSHTASSLPVQLTLFGPAAAVAAGGNHSCALHLAGEVFCWGANDRGQLGTGTTTAAIVPTLVAGLPPATAVVAGNAHTCALLVDGTARCWGANDRGQLGTGTTADSPTPVPLSPAGLTFTELAAGAAHTCGLHLNGSFHCWGAGDAGQLGNDAVIDSPVPVSVSRVSMGTAIAAGSAHSCALDYYGNVWCWGLQNGTVDRSPAVVPGLTATAIAAGGLPGSLQGGHTLVVLTDGTLRAWGDNTYGQLGDGTSGAPPPASVTVVGISSAVNVTAGWQHSCAILGDGTGRCWGADASGQLGNFLGTGIPSLIQGLTAITQLSAGGAHTLAVQ